MINRYEARLLEWQEKFRQNGREIVSQHGRYPVTADSRIPVTFFNKEYYVNLSGGRLYQQNGTPCPLQAMTQMMIYNHLERLQPDAVPAGQMLRLGEIGGVKHMSRAIIAVSPPTEALIRALDGDPTLGARIIAAFCGAPAQVGDISFTLPAFRDVCYQYIYWAGEAEFPSTLTTFADANVTQFIHPEGALLVGGIGVELICQAMGIPYEKWSWET